MQLNAKRPSNYRRFRARERRSRHRRLNKGINQGDAETDSSRFHLTPPTLQPVVTSKQQMA